MFHNVADDRRPFASPPPANEEAEVDFHNLLGETEEEQDERSLVAANVVDALINSDDDDDGGDRKSSAHRRVVVSPTTNGARLAGWGDGSSLPTSSSNRTPQPAHQSFAVTSSKGGGGSGSSVGGTMLVTANSIGGLMGSGGGHVGGAVTPSTIRVGGPPIVMPPGMNPLQQHQQQQQYLQQQHYWHCYTSAEARAHQAMADATYHMPMVQRDRGGGGNNKQTFPTVLVPLDQTEALGLGRVWLRGPEGSTDASSYTYVWSPPSSSASSDAAIPLPLVAHVGGETMQQSAMERGHAAVQWIFHCRQVTAMMPSTTQPLGVFPLPSPPTSQVRASRTPPTSAKKKAATAGGQSSLATDAVTPSSASNAADPTKTASEASSATKLEAASQPLLCRGYIWPSSLNRRELRSIIYGRTTVEAFHENYSSSNTKEKERRMSSAGDPLAVADGATAINTSTTVAETTAAVSTTVVVNLQDVLDGKGGLRTSGRNGRSKDPASLYGNIDKVIPIPEGLWASLFDDHSGIITYGEGTGGTGGGTTTADAAAAPERDVIDNNREGAVTKDEWVASHDDIRGPPTATQPPDQTGGNAAFNKTASARLPYCYLSSRDYRVAIKKLMHYRVANTIEGFACSDEDEAVATRPQLTIKDLQGEAQ